MHLKVKIGNRFYLNAEGGCSARFHMQSYAQYLEYFLPKGGFTYEIISDGKSDITIWDNVFGEYTQEMMKNDEVNVLVCVENSDYWKSNNSWYYRHYDRSANITMFDICIYNHIPKLTIQPNGCLETPMLHRYITYYCSHKEDHAVKTPVPFVAKKFCISINRSGMNPEIDNTRKLLGEIGQVDDISLYNDILNTSCYHSCELIDVLNKYKFVICFENSYSDGYLTEKIFNCFLAGVIPIYKGCPDITNYIQPSCFVDARRKECLLDTIRMLSMDEVAYSQRVNDVKISETYSDEEHGKIITEQIMRKLTKMEMRKTE